MADAAVCGEDEGTQKSATRSDAHRRGEKYSQDAPDNVWIAPGEGYIHR